MDLPKALLQKKLPKGGGGQAAPVGTPKTKAASGATKGATAGTVDAAQEDEVFLQAMQGMVKPPHSKKPVTKQGSFPLHERSAFKNMPQVEEPEVILERAEPVEIPKESLPAQEGELDFALAMRTVKALKGKGRDIIPEIEAADAATAQGTTVQDLLDGEIVFDVHLAGDIVQGHVVGLDEKSFLALSSGAHSPEARLDLHGLNANQAFQALVPFFRTAWHKNLRTLIVVTGRGANSPTGMAVLRQKLQVWLTQEPFKRVVMAFCTARPCDGGTGSMYVLLRKYRKKHRVYWERCPSDSDLFENFPK